MSTLRIEATLNQDGKLVLEDLPFRAGDAVEVTISHNANGGAIDILLSKSSAESHQPDSYPLRDTVIKYERPTEPVGLEDWDDSE
ncbi:MAG TPA: hypothetical protein VMS31_15940 [Pyrinomonadaceae bacterium]|nr:hypothetical protein [Pyrinomonadaceae bacterium]